MAQVVELMQFPDEILVNILSFVPNRFEVASVCRKFYELICKIDSKKYKLNVGRRYGEDLDKSAILNTQRVFDSADIWLEFKDETDSKLVQEIFQRHGSKLEKLSWINWSDFQFKADQVIDMLNSMPDLKELEMSSWRVSFSPKEVADKKLNLKALKRIQFSEAESFIVEFFAQNLPQVGITELKIKRMNVPDETLKTFIDAQPSIKSLDFGGDVFDVRTFQQLKLNSLRCVLSESESPMIQKSFLKALIQSQPELISLDTLCDMDYSFTFIDDEIFREICKLKQLKSLKMNIDGITSDSAQRFADLRNLKVFEAKTNRDNALDSFKEISLMQNLPLETLVLQLWSFEIPAPTYQQFGQNFKLKHLTITLGTRHKINFYVESFPTLESLSIRFGEANHHVLFSESFSIDCPEHLNMKRLKLEFTGGEEINPELFIKMLQKFPNLEHLDVQLRFPFSSETINQLANNLNNLKSLTMNRFFVGSDEKFPPALVQSFKDLRKKLTFCDLTLMNTDEDSYECIIDGPRRPRPSEEFTYDPLIAALKFDFNLRDCSMANIRTYNILNLKAGKPLPDF